MSVMNLYGRLFDILHLPHTGQGRLHNSIDISGANFLFQLQLHLLFPNYFLFVIRFAFSGKCRITCTLALSVVPSSCVYIKKSGFRNALHRPKILHVFFSAPVRSSSVSSSPQAKSPMPRMFASR